MFGLKKLSVVFIATMAFLMMQKEVLAGGYEQCSWCYLELLLNRDTMENNLKVKLFFQIFLAFELRF